MTQDTRYLAMKLVMACKDDEKAVLSEWFGPLLDEVAASMGVDLDARIGDEDHLERCWELDTKD